MEEEEYENVGKIHLESSSISTISAAISTDSNIAVYAQIKSGKIIKFNFASNKFDAIQEIDCGTFTFCRMSSLQAEGDVILALPSPELENAIDVLYDASNAYLLKNFLVQSSGMCLFAKLFSFRPDKVILLCGYESGKLVVVNIDRRTKDYEIVFEERILEESCTDADITVDGTVVAVSAGKSIKLIRNIWTLGINTTSTIELPFAGCNTVAIRPDGKLFVTGGWDCKLRYFSLKTGKLLAVLDHHFDAITEIKFRNDFGVLASSSDGTISLWTLYT